MRIWQEREGKQNELQRVFSYDESCTLEHTQRSMFRREHEQQDEKVSYSDE